MLKKEIRTSGVAIQMNNRSLNKFIYRSLLLSTKNKNFGTAAGKSCAESFSFDRVTAVKHIQSEAEKWSHQRSPSLLAWRQRNVQRLPERLLRFCPLLAVYGLQGPQHLARNPLRESGAGICYSCQNIFRSRFSEVL